jgi:hypothetical protein
MMDLAEINPADCVGWVLQIINLPPGGHNSMIFEGDYELVPPKSLRQRTRENLVFWRA